MINKMLYGDAAEIHGRSQKWLNFARRCIKNPAMRELIITRDAHQCQWCHKPVRRNEALHHIDYDHECVTEKTIRLPNPTTKRPTRTIDVPDCGNCALIQQCAKRLALVHQMCNKEIAQHALKASQET